jgi:hypothetical protein
VNNTVDFVNAIAPSVIGGALSIAGVIVLFWLQQRAQRQADRQARRVDAVEHLLNTLNDARLAFRDGKPKTADKISEMYANSWRFAWLLDKKERPVADWAFAILIKTLRDLTDLSKTQRDAALAGVVVTVMEGLNHWRTGSRKPGWFAVEHRRLTAPTDSVNINT